MYIDVCIHIFYLNQKLQGMILNTQIINKTQSFFSTSIQQEESTILSQIKSKKQKEKDKFTHTNSIYSFQNIAFVINSYNTMPTLTLLQNLKKKKSVSPKQICTQILISKIDFFPSSSGFMQLFPFLFMFIQKLQK